MPEKLGTSTATRVVACLELQPSPPARRPQGEVQSAIINPQIHRNNTTSKTPNRAP